MKTNAWFLKLALVAAFEIFPLSTFAALATYEFTGTSTGDDQFNAVTAQPANGSFSTFTRVNVTWVSTADVFKSSAWSTGTQDTSEYVHFIVTADSGYELDLISLTFTFQRTATGPQNGEVSLFLNGESTPTTSFSFTPSTSSQSSTWDSGSANPFPSFLGVTTAEFRFYGWSAGSGAGNILFDNVSVEGGITAVPEPARSAFYCALGLLAIGGGSTWLNSRRARLRS